MLALTVAMAVLLYLDRFALTVVTPEIIDDLSISKSQMGTAISAFFFAYALGQVPAGWFADRMGPRRALALYVGAWSLAIVGVAMSRTLGALVVARLLLGLSQAGAYPAAAGMIKRWIPFERRGFASGAVTMGGRGGGLLSSVLTPYLMLGFAGFDLGSQGGLWRPVLILYGALGLVWAGVFSVWFRNSPREHAGVNAAELALIERPASAAAAEANPSTARSATPWEAILTSRNVWLLCLVNFFVNVGWIFLATWLATYLREVHHISLQAAGWLTAGTALAGMAGCLTGGWTTDRLVRRLGLLWGRRTPALLSCGGAARRLPGVLRWARVHGGRDGGGGLRLFPGRHDLGHRLVHLPGYWQRQRGSRARLRQYVRKPGCLVFFGQDRQPGRTRELVGRDADRRRRLCGRDGVLVVHRRARADRAADCRGQVRVHAHRERSMSCLQPRPLPSAARHSATRYGTGSLPSALSTVPPAVNVCVTSSGWPYFSCAVPPSPPPM